MVPKYVSLYSNGGIFCIQGEKKVEHTLAQTTCPTFHILPSFRLRLDCLFYSSQALRRDVYGHSHCAEGVSTSRPLSIVSIIGMPARISFIDRLTFGIKTY